MMTVGKSKPQAAADEPCTHCGCPRAGHDLNGRCRLWLRGSNCTQPCDCPGYEPRLAGGWRHDDLPPFAVDGLPTDVRCRKCGGGMVFPNPNGSTFTVGWSLEDGVCFQHHPSCPVKPS